MSDIDKLQKEEIEELSHEDKIMELDQLITEGVNAKLPFTFIYPNTDKKVGVMVRPLSTNEYQSAIIKSKKLKTNFLTELCKIGLYKLDGSEFPKDKIDDLPAGVVTIICNELARISGIDLLENTEVNQSMIDDFMGF